MVCRREGTLPRSVDVEVYKYSGIKTEGDLWKVTSLFSLSLLQSVDETCLQLGNSFRFDFKRNRCNLSKFFCVAFYQINLHANVHL